MAMTPAVSKVLLNTILVSLFLFPRSLHSAPEASRVAGLPGFSGTFPSKHYSGYVKVGKKSVNHEKNLFYYFVVSERNPATDPVVLWLNGGPGCSSFDGFVYEHGPFNFEEGKNKSDLPTLHLNPFSWSKVSNIIYLDSPVGTGFSYSFQRHHGDLQTANDTRDFLLKWFELYPEFQANPFYVSGESYAGIYIPTLVTALDKAKSSGAKPEINLKGYLIGNGATDDNFDGENALVPFAHGHGLIPDKLYKEADEACHGEFQDNKSQNCTTLVDSIDEILLGLNLYNILEPCYHNNASFTNTKLPASFRELGKTDKPLPVRRRMFGRSWPHRAPVRDGIVPTWSQLSETLGNTGVIVPCVSGEVATKYLNDKAVRKAIHVNPKSGYWNMCSDLINYHHDSGSMIPYHKNLINKGYRALIYSGDHDMCIPYTGTEAWTSSLGLQIVDEWRSWISNDQIAGYLQEYAKNLTFLTIKGAGHMVPEYKPSESLDFYDRWLQGHEI